MLVDLAWVQSDPILTSNPKPKNPIILKKKRHYLSDPSLLVATKVNTIDGQGNYTLNGQCPFSVIDCCA
jgi:hypothetical protein